MQTQSRYGHTSHIVNMRMRTAHMAQIQKNIVFIGYLT